MAVEAEVMSGSEERGSRAIGWAEKGLVPDGAIRAGIRRLCRQRLEEIRADDLQASSDAKNAFVAAMNEAEVAPVPELAIEQLY